MNPNQQEIEASLAICAADAGAVADAIAALTQIGDFALVRPAELALRDVYWDLPDGSLGRERMALRLRMEGGDTWITLKGPPSREREGLSRRLELEAPWSAAALVRISSALNDAGLLAMPGKVTADKETPQALLRALGFRIVQERETRRRTRDVVLASAADAPALAELAVDRTTYRFDDRAVVHHEIEIEVKGAGGEPAVEQVMGALREQYGAALRPWTYGKLFTGTTIKTLLIHGDLDGKIGRDGALLPAAYDRLEAAFPAPGVAAAR